MNRAVSESTEEYISITEAAEAAGIGVGIVRRAIKAGKIVTKIHPWGTQVRLLDIANLPHLSEAQREQLLKRAEDYKQKNIRSHTKGSEYTPSQQVKIGGRKRPGSPGSLQRRIIEQIRQMQQPVTVAQVQEHLLTAQNLEYEYTVILKAMQRMVRTNVLLTTKISATTLYAFMMPQASFAYMVVGCVLESLASDFGEEGWQAIIGYLNNGKAVESNESEPNIAYHVGEWGWISMKSLEVKGVFIAKPICSGFVPQPNVPRSSDSICAIMSS